MLQERLSSAPHEEEFCSLLIMLADALSEISRRSHDYCGQRGQQRPLPALLQPLKPLIQQQCCSLLQLPSQLGGAHMGLRLSTVLCLEALLYVDIALPGVKQGTVTQVQEVLLDMMAEVQQPVPNELEQQLVRSPAGWLLAPPGWHLKAAELAGRLLLTVGECGRLGISEVRRGQLHRLVVLPDAAGALAGTAGPADGGGAGSSGGGGGGSSSSSGSGGGGGSGGSSDDQVPHSSTVSMLIDA